MWGTFHQLRCSQSFRAMWNSFLTKTLAVDACPIFYQYITDTFFRNMIKQQFQLTNQEEQGGSDQALSYNEKNALRYAAGYVIRHLQKQVKRSAHPFKDELEFCLIELNETDNEESDESEDWVKNIDRGGLKHITNMTYMMFESMEIELRRHLRIADMAHGSGIKDKVKTEIVSNEDVRFYWCIVSADWDEEKSQCLLHMICDLWITIRGFSTVSGWLEKYKQTQTHKKTVQKSKGVRKQLCK